MAIKEAEKRTKKIQIQANLRSQDQMIKNEI